MSKDKNLLIRIKDYLKFLVKIIFLSCVIYGIYRIYSFYSYGLLHYYKINKYELNTLLLIPPKINKINNNLNLDDILNYTKYDLLLLYGTLGFILGYSIKIIL